MLKKIALVLLGLNFLTSKSVVGCEPLSTGMAVSYVVPKVALLVVTGGRLLVKRRCEKKDNCEKTEYLFCQCLAINKASTHLNAAGIPAACESVEKICRLCVGNDRTDTIIAEFKAEKAVDAFRSRMGKASAVIAVGKLMRPYVAPTETEMLQQSIKRNYDTYKTAEKELITCIDKHAYPDRTIVPKACEEIALKYYFHATGKNYYDELMKKNNVG
jgi:hypothetical protein